MKKEILTKCGYRCDLCPAYKENIKCEEDIILLSKEWHRLFGFDIPPQNVECVGCINEGSHADKDCPVRPCVIEKKLENCAYCDDFGCDKLKTRMNFIDDFFTKKDKILSDKDYKKYVSAYESKRRLIKIRETLK
jgi:hypothetical protein